MTVAPSASVFASSDDLLPPHPASSPIDIAATNTADLVQGIGSISAQMKENKEIAEKLNDEAGKFERV